MTYQLLKPDYAFGQAGKHASADLSLNSGAQTTASLPQLEVRIHSSESRHLVVDLHGEVDEGTAPLLEVVMNAVAHHGSKDRSPGTVTFDLAGLAFIYMRGIALLQKLCERLTSAGWQISLVNARPNVADLLMIARQHHSLTLTGPAWVPVAPSHS